MAPSSQGRAALAMGKYCHFSSLVYSSRRNSRLKKNKSKAKFIKSKKYLWAFASMFLIIGLIISTVVITKKLSQKDDIVSKITTIDTPKINPSYPVVEKQEKVDSVKLNQLLVDKKFEDVNDLLLKKNDADQYYERVCDSIKNYFIMKIESISTKEENKNFIDSFYINNSKLLKNINFTKKEYWKQAIDDLSYIINLTINYSTLEEDEKSKGIDMINKGINMINKYSDIFPKETFELAKKLNLVFQMKYTKTDGKLDSIDVIKTDTFNVKIKTQVIVKCYNVNSKLKENNNNLIQFKVNDESRIYTIKCNDSVTIYLKPTN